jgi:hypothetical protein
LLCKNVPHVSRKIVTRGIFGKYRCPRLSCSLFLTERWFRRNNKMISGLKCPQKYRYDQDSSIRSNFFARSDAVLTYCISQYGCMICKQCILYRKLEVLGFPAPPCADRGLLIVAQRRLKHTDTIFYVVRQNRLHPRERIIVLEIEKGLQNNTWRRITQLPVHTLCCIWQQGCCHGQQLLFLSSSLLFTLSHTLCTLSLLLSIRHASL